MQTWFADRYSVFRAKAISRLRLGCLVGSVFWIVLTVAVYRQEPWVTWLWPWSEGRMAYIFLASITAAVAAPTLWCALTNDMAALAGLALDAIAVNAGMTVSLVAMAIARNEYRLLIFAAGTLFFALVSIIGFRVANSLPLHNRQTTPLPVRAAFGIFVLALLYVGLSLILRVDGVFPWALASGTSTMIGTLFLGAASYFVFGLIRNKWVHGGGQLAGFLAYDLILIRPYLTTWIDRNDTDSTPRFGSYSVGSTELNETSLLVYLIVLISSGLLATYYLFIHRTTRVWRHLGLERPAAQFAPTGD